MTKKFKFVLIDNANATGCAYLTRRAGKSLAVLASDDDRRNPWLVIEKYETPEGVGLLIRAEPADADRVEKCEFVVYRNNNWELGAYVGRFRLQETSDAVAHPTDEKII